MLACLSAATTLPSTFADDVKHFADAGCRAMEVWLTKLETHLDTHSLAATRTLVADAGLTLVAAAYQGGLLLSQGEQRKAHFDHLRRRLDLCQHLRIPTLLIVPDFITSQDERAPERALVSLAQAAEWAASYDMHSPWSFRAAVPGVAASTPLWPWRTSAAQANVGVCLDVFHYYTGPSKFEDLGLLTLDRLYHVQLCDLAGTPREVATDADRILPGDGDFQLRPIVEFLKGLGYDGGVSVETLNPTLWQANPQQVVEIAITALRKLLGM